MPELGSYGSVGAGEGNLSLYPDILTFSFLPVASFGRYCLTLVNGGKGKFRIAK